LPWTGPALSSLGNHARALWAGPSSARVVVPGRWAPASGSAHPPAIGPNRSHGRVTLAADAVAILLGGTRLCQWFGKASSWGVLTLKQGTIQDRGLSKGVDRWRFKAAAGGEVIPRFSSADLSDGVRQVRQIGSGWKRFITKTPVDAGLLAVPSNNGGDGAHGVKSVDLDGRLRNGPLSPTDWHPDTARRQDSCETQMDPEEGASASAGH
jgi:hypothetical protein